MKKYQNEQWLREQYWEKELSCSEIGKLCGITSSGIGYYMKKFDIPLRSRSDSVKLMWARGIFDDEEYHKKISAAKKRDWERGIYDSEEYRQKLSMAQKVAHARGDYDEMYASEKWLRKNSESKKTPEYYNKRYTEEWRQKNKAAQKIAQNRPEVKEKKSKAMKALHESGIYGEEWRQKNSRAQKIVQNRPEVKENKSKIMKRLHREGVFGKEWRLKRSGASNSRWLGGISFEPYGLDFNKTLKESIRKRDGYRCAICNEGGRCVHHIDYNKKNNLSANLITLCRACHCKTNSQRDYWQMVFVNTWLLVDKWWEISPANI